MLNCPSNLPVVEAEQGAVEQQNAPIPVAGEWRVGDESQLWDVSLTDQIRSALRQCVSRRTGVTRLHIYSK
jgi:hypothetical protein